MHGTQKTKHPLDSRRYSCCAIGLSFPGIAIVFAT